MVNLRIRIKVVKSLNSLLVIDRPMSNLFNLTQIVVFGGLLLHGLSIA